MTSSSNLVNSLLIHDKITKFLNNQLLGSKKLWSYVRPDFKSAEKSRAIILDDAIEENLYADASKIRISHSGHYLVSKDQFIVIDNVLINPI